MVGVVLRRLVAGLAALVLVVEAAVLVLVHFVLGRTTHNQSMSIAGMDPDVMSTATYVMGAGIGAFLLLCAVLLVVAAVRDRPRAPSPASCSSPPPSPTGCSAPSPSAWSAGAPSR